MKNNLEYYHKKRTYKVEFEISGEGMYDGCPLLVTHIRQHILPFLDKDTAKKLFGESDVYSTVSKLKISRRV